MTDVAGLQAEVEALRRRNAELEALLAEKQGLEEALRASEARYRAILEDQTELICRFRSDGTLTYVNEAYCRYFGKTRDELIGRSFAQLIPEEDQGIMAQTLARLGPEMPLTSSEHRVIRADGSVAWQRWTDRALFDEAGNVVEYQSVGADVTERRLAEDEVRRLNAELRRDAVERSGELRNFHALAESMPDGVALARLDGEIFYANQAYQQLSGLGPDLIGRTLLEVHPDAHPALTGTGEEGCYEEELALLLPDGGALPCEVSVLRVEGGEGVPPALAVLARDLSAKKRAESERAALQAQVIEAQQSVIRELSTPLLPLADHVVAMPLIGVIDSGRAAAALETLLSGVVTHQASTVVLDVTGVSVVDSQVADAILRAARAVRLLGAEVVLTGIQPHVAQTLVTLGIEVTDMVTLRALKDGIAYALRNERRRQAASAARRTPGRAEEGRARSGQTPP
uniref:PAS/PAC sensor protein n=1 Tax=Jahnella sp. MSr9139 TaxID=1434086 RepID=A0A4Y5SZI3_9BACT|nr:PAS/PAC sensor protein [Jahnella sp. MSr9139]